MTLHARFCKTAGVAVALVLALTMTGCGGDDSGATTDAGPTTAIQSTGSRSSGSQSSGGSTEAADQYSFTISKAGLLVRAPEFSELKNKVGTTVQFILKNKSPYDFHLDLIGVDGNTKISGADGNKGEQIRFTVTLKKPGLYRLKFYHGKSSPNWRPFKVTR